VAAAGATVRRLAPHCIVGGSGCQFAGSAPTRGHGG